MRVIPKARADISGKVEMSWSIDRRQITEEADPDDGKSRKCRTHQNCAFTLSLLVQEGSECKDIFNGSRTKGCRKEKELPREKRPHGHLGARPAIVAFSVVPLELLHDPAGAYGKGEKFFVLGKGLLQRSPVVDNYVPFSEVGFCKISTIRPTEDQDLITDSLEHDVSFVNHDFFWHTPPEKGETDGIIEHLKKQHLYQLRKENNR